MNKPEKPGTTDHHCIGAGCVYCLNLRADERARELAAAHPLKSCEEHDKFQANCLACSAANFEVEPEAPATTVDQTTTPPAVQVDTPAEAQRALRFLMYYVMCVEPREADKAVVEMVTKGHSPEEAQRLVADYVWDHIMGEPEEFSAEQLLEVYRKYKAILSE